MLKGAISCVFQDYAKYQIRLRDNILMGSRDAGESENARLGRAIGAVKLEELVDELPNGLDTPLGKIEEDGQDVSGGQWQRIALARSVASGASLRILDEPTAALDPISESKVYSQFGSISRGSTTIFISHRLGSTSLADIIFVIDDGHIKESGSHRELMDKNGLYAEMYDSQRSWYV